MPIFEMARFNRLEVEVGRSLNEEKPRAPRLLLANEKRPNLYVSFYDQAKRLPID